MEKMEIAEQAFAEGLPYPKNYSGRFLVLETGQGVWLLDRAGNRYLDFGSGISVNALGYGREDLAHVASEQMKKLIHVSNLYTTQPTVELATRLVESGPYDAVHFGNSGSEANEAAIKYARMYSLRTKGEGHHKLLCFTNGFHGRTMGALSCTATAKYQDPFGPLVPGVQVTPYNDVEALRSTLDSSFAAVIVETLQGEGGLDGMTDSFAGALNELCKKHDVVLVADEVQTGLGRTGALYGSPGVGLEPTVLTLSKPLAAGLPLSATLIPSRINDLLHVGEHGTTFGGGPVTTAVAVHVWDLLTAEGFLDQVAATGRYMADQLDRLCQKHPSLGRRKGCGLLQGITVETGDPGQIIADCQMKGLLVLKSGSNVIRLAPPLVITTEEIDHGLAILDQVVGAADEE